MTMDFGQMPKYRLSSESIQTRKRPSNSDRRQRWEPRASYDSWDAEIGNYETKGPFTHQSPRDVKSLLTGRAVHPELPTSPSKAKAKIKPNFDVYNNSAHVVIRPEFRKPPKTMPKTKSKQKTKTKPITSPSSFLASIGACTGVGKIGTSFLNERNEESNFHFPFGGVNCNRNANTNDTEEEMEELITRLNANPYSNPIDDDEKEMNDMIARFAVFSEGGFHPTRSTTDNTAETTKITIESIDVGSTSTGSSIKLNRHNKNPSDAFSSVRHLLFGDDKAGATATARKDATDYTSFDSATAKTTELSSFRCNSHSNVLEQCQKQNPCLQPNDSEFRQWNSNPVFERASSNSCRSLLFSFDPPEAQYAAAYGDEDEDIVAGSKSRSHMEEDIYDSMCYEKNSLLQSLDHENSLLQSIAGSSYTSNTHTQQNSHHEIQYWMQRLHYATKYYGKSHLSTADAYFNLGRAQLDFSVSYQESTDLYPRSPIAITKHSRDASAQQKHQYDLAVENLTIAHGIWERKHGPNHLAVGRALDSLALAIVRRANHDRSKSSGKSNSNDASTIATRDQDLRYARRLLEQAFAIRNHHLGAWHVDTVEAYNKLASVLLHLGLLKEASKAYREVFLVRRAIFGNGHPSVAIAAHSLANCHFKIGAVKESLGWYRISLDVYETMGLSYRHPAVTKLLLDQSRLEEYMEQE